jgi:tRNA(fMet)-specific endonuclease VapC
LTLLLDSDTCIALVRGRPPGPRRRFAACLGEGQTLSVSVISLHELWFGVAGSDRPEAGAVELNQLTRIVQVLALDREDARAAAGIRYSLKRVGTPIGPFDMLIAGQALARDMTLVTGNRRELARVRGLRLESWLD